MTTFVAYYRSPDASAMRSRGLFEFESDARLGSKANLHDARLRMLEMFGNDALSWNIEKVEHVRATNARSDGQLELDFRAPVKKKRKRSKGYW